MRRDKQPAIGETVPAHTPEQWRAQLGQDVEIDQLVTGEREFRAHRSAEIGREAEASGSPIPVNLQNAEAALERIEQHKQELYRIHFLMRDAQQELLQRIMDEGWFDLLRVNTAGFKRRMRYMKNPR